MIDYIFYRTYLAYQKADDLPHISATLYVAASVAFLFLPLLIPFVELLRGGNNVLGLILYLLYFIMVLLWATIRYWSIIKVNDIVDRYSGCKANKNIPTWCIFFFMPMCIAIFIIGMLLIQNIMDYFNLTGIGYRYLQEVFPSI